MKALRTTSDDPRARGRVPDATPGKRTLVEAQYGDVLPRAPGAGSPAPLSAPSVGQPSPVQQAASPTSSGSQAGPQPQGTSGNAPSGERVGAPPSLDAPWS